jgi:hypothetical protein
LLVPSGPGLSTLLGHRGAASLVGRGCRQVNRKANE